nr:hypothetical protein [Actinomycetota bacterium]
MPIGPTTAASPSRLVPSPSGPIFGRATELALIQELLAGDCRLVTLTGTGGAGKTFLALHAIAEGRAFKAGGIRFVPLGAVRDSAEVAAAIARSVGLREAGARGLVPQLVAHLSRRTTLLVLDNFEQVMAATPLVAELLESCPRLKILATSRSSLRLAGEREVPVPPLEVREAIRLLVQRAQAVAPTFELTEENAPTITEICRRLDGLPLAIELAAARTRLLSPEEILDRTAEPLTLLTGGRRDAPARQRTLRATIDWSYALLDEREQAVFRSLAVFAGGCTLAGAAAVLGGGDESSSLLEDLDSLVDKGLVRRESHGGVTRLALLDTIRDYALEKLFADAAGGSVAEMHAQYFLHIAECLHDQSGPPEGVLERVDAEYENLLAALAYRLERRDPRAVELWIALLPLWSVGGRLSEGRHWWARVRDAELAAS